MIEFEKFLAPWECDKDGKPLAEPAEVDPAKLKKHLYNILSDKEKEQEKSADLATELAGAKETLVTVQREHETADQARERQEKEREARYDKLEKEATERRKIEAIEAEFEGITSARAKRLAKRVTSDNEKDWLVDARELVEDGFRISDKPAENPAGGEGDNEQTDDLSIRPHLVRRADGTPVKETGKAKQSVKEILDAAIPTSTW